MADYVVKNNESFEFTYSATQQEEIERIRNKYLPKQESKMDQYVKLDKQVEVPGQIASIVAGTAGLLFFGVGMCLLPEWNMFSAGVVMLLFLIPMCVGLKDSKKDNQQ